MDDRQDSEIDQLLKQTYAGERTRFQFEDWKMAYPASMAYLNPVVTDLYVANRRLWMRVIGFSIAASILLVVGSFVALENRRAFASTVCELRKAKTMSWEMTTFLRCYGTEPGQVWLSALRSKYEYQEPGLFRITSFAEEDRLSAIEVIDVLGRKYMRLDVQAKTCTFDERMITLMELPPLQSIMKSLDSNDLEYLGEKTVEGRMVSAFRHQQLELAQSMEIWVDADSKRLVGAAVTSADRFDPLAVGALGNPLGFSLDQATMVGTVLGNIQINPRLDDFTFSFEHAGDYAMRSPAPASLFSENEFVQYLGVACQANGGSFSDSLDDFETKLYNRIERVARESRTEEQAKFQRQFYLNFVNGNIDPIGRFVEQCVVGGSFRYIGKGVRFGEHRIVCFYQLPGADDYRAVYGDLQVRSLSADELPLPVE